ncbi:hypothetical protein SAMN05428988_3228 [Chitinophaga sp. YR573]|nr:hypothetical protein SAMN05428988_3228 [Chitinophaga sp. YR573]
MDIYATVGMQRQQQYEQGVQKVNSYLDSLSGLNIARQVDSDYLQGRIGELAEKVNKVASADWSGRGIVNQVGKLAGIVANDPVIKNAVIGTQKYLKDESDIAEAKKNGKWAPENEWLLRREMSSWMNAPQPGVSYQTGGYKPYEDVAAEVIKSWKDAKPNSTLVQRPNGDFYAYETVNNETVGKDGRTLIETSVKELRPDQIADQINGLLTGGQREQLAFSGLYQHRNINSPDDLNKLIDGHFKTTEGTYQRLLDNENLEMSLQAGNAGKIAEIKERIAAIEKKRSELSGSKKSYKEAALTNPDGIKSSIYYESWLGGVSNMLGFSETSTKVVDNPSYKAMFEEFKVWADLQKAQMAATVSMAHKSSAKSKKSDDEEGGGWSPVTATVLPLSEKDRRGITLDSFRGRLQSVGDQMDQSMMGLLYRKFGESYVNRTVKDLNGDGITEDVYSIKKGSEGAAIRAQAEWWDAYRKGDPGLDITIKETLKDADEKRLVSTKLAKVLNDVEGKADNYVRTTSQFQAYKNAENRFNSQPAVQIYGSMISPGDLKAYESLRISTSISTPSLGIGSPGGTYTPAPDAKTLAQYGLTPEKYNAILKAEGSDDTPEGAHLSSLRNLYQQTIKPLSRVNADKAAYIKDEIKKYAGIFNEVALTLPSAKPDELRPIANFVSTLAANARETEMGGATNWKKVREMINGDHLKETAYSYVQDKDGNVRLRISNPDVDKNNPQEIVVDSQTARINNFSVPDFLSSTRSLLELGENIRTGNSFEESIPTSNELTGRYQVRHEVENFNGRYKVKLYISDPQNKEINAREVPINNVLFSDWNQLTAFLKNDVTERFITSLLAPAQSSPAGTSGYNFQNNFFSTNPLIPGYNPTR